jgi:hypothetical protein
MSSFVRHVRAPHVLAKLGLGEECGFKQLFYKFIILIINILTKVIKFIIKKLNLNVFVLDLSKYI